MTLGILIDHGLYNLLEDQEQELLYIKTLQIRDHFSQIIQEFKRETASLYSPLYPNQNQMAADYLYFLPRNVPLPNDQRSNLEQERFFKQKLQTLLDRHNYAEKIIFYRSSDKKWFHAAKKNVSIREVHEDFFSNVPKEYSFPFFGNIGTPYLINPIFDFHSIHHNKPIGYFMLILDEHSIYDFRNIETGNPSRMIINQGDQQLFDNQPHLDMIGNKALFITSKIALDRYNLEFTGLKDKWELQSKLNSLRIVYIIVIISAWLLCLLFISKIQKTVRTRFNELSQQFKKVQHDPFVEPLIVKSEDEIDHLIIRFNKMTFQLQEHIQHRYIAEFQKEHAEYYALKMQINPHFLYNTFESLRMYALVNKQKMLAEKIYILAELFRWILRSEQDIISLEEEIQYTQYYLDLLMIGKDLSIGFEVKSDLPLSSVTIMKFSLQPIIENAIFHRELEKEDEPLFMVNAMVKDGFQIIEVINNGKGMSNEEQIQLQHNLNNPELFKAQHLGLKNIHERIRTYYGKAYGLNVIRMNPENGFGIYMKIPLHKQENNLRR